MVQNHVELKLSQISTLLICSSVTSQSRWSHTHKHTCSRDHNPAMQPALASPSTLAPFYSGTFPSTLLSILDTVSASLILSNNQFYGSLPVDTNFTPASGSIIYIDFSSNYLNSTLPDAWSTLSPSLSGLLLQNNSFTSSIPSNWSPSTNLIALDLESNPCLCGPVPAWLTSSSIPSSNYTTNTGVGTSCTSLACSNLQILPTYSHPDAPGLASIVASATTSSTYLSTYWTTGITPCSDLDPVRKMCKRFVVRYRNCLQIAIADSGWVLCDTGNLQCLAVLE